MATNYLRVHHQTTPGHKDRRSQNWKHLQRPGFNPRPSGSISPMYRDNLFAIDPPSYTPSLNTSTSGEERFLAGRPSRPSVQYSNQLASTSGSNPRTGGGGSSKSRRRPRGSVENHIVDKRRSGERHRGKLDLSVLDNLVTFTAPTVNHARVTRFVATSRRSI